MDWAEAPVAIRGILIVAAALMAWMVLKVVLRITLRLFTIGCLGIAIVLVIGGIAGWLG